LNRRTDAAKLAGHVTTGVAGCGVDAATSQETEVSQPYDPTYGVQPGPGAPGVGTYQVPPADDGEYIHPHQRAVLWVTRAVTYVIYAFIIAAEIILLIGFLLLLMGANASSSFVQWCYRNLDRVMEPFRGIFTPIELGTAQNSEVASVFDTSVLFAMIIYAIVGIAIYGFASWLTKRLYRLDVEDREYHARNARERQAYLDRMTAERIAATQAAATLQASRPAPTPPTPQPTSPPPPA
jgi:hypothetical protein